MKALSIAVMLIILCSCTRFHTERVDYLDQTGQVYRTDVTVDYSHYFQNKNIKGQVVRLDDGSYEVVFDSGTKNDPTIQVLDRGIELGKLLAVTPVP